MWKIKEVNALIDFLKMIPISILTDFYKLLSFLTISISFIIRFYNKSFLFCRILYAHVA